MSEVKFLTVLTAILLLAPPAHAGVSSGYLCTSAQPYDHFAVIDDGARSAIAFRLPGNNKVVPLSGRVPAGQSPQLESRNGLMIVPLVLETGPVVDVYFRQKQVARFPGVLQDADIGGIRGELALITTSQSKAASSDEAQVTQSVVNNHGRILASRQFTMRLNEDDAQHFRLTERGDGIYRVLSENSPASTLQVLDVLSFLPRLSVTAPGLAFTDVWMQTAHEGFAIGNGRIFRIANGKLRAMTTLQDAFHATRIEYDPRSNRVLVLGTDGFWVFDGLGRKLLGQRGLSSVKLTIEGDVVEYNGATGQARLWQRRTNYDKPVTLSLDRVSNWNAIACLTSDTAAVARPDTAGSRSRLLRFGD